MSLEDELAHMAESHDPPAQPVMLGLSSLIGEYRKLLILQGFSPDEAFVLVRDYHDAVLASQAQAEDEDDE